MTAPERRPSVGQSRHLAPEVEELLKQRLMRYKRRARRTMDGVASDLSSWPSIVQWVPSAFAKSSRPTFTRRMLDTWITGDTSHAERRFTKPKGDRLVVIAEFLIEKGLVKEFELASDDTGLALAGALQSYCQRLTVRGDIDISGEYEGYTHGHGEVCFHHLTIHREARAKAYLINYDVIVSYKHDLDRTTAIKERLLNRSPFTAEKLRRGWAAELSNGGILALLRCPNDSRSSPAPWVWASFTHSGTSILRLISGEEEISASREQLEVTSHTRLPVLKRLTSHEELNYYQLERKEGSDSSIIRRIMARIERSEISGIDDEFLRAAHCCDPDRMVKALDAGADINVIDPATGLTALLNAASRGVRGIIDILIERPGLNPTITDRHGRLASDLILFTMAGSEHFASYAEKLIDVEVTYEEQHPPSP